MPTIVHIIGGLNLGGAERMLQRLVIAHSKQADVKTIVISLTDLGIIGKELQEQNIRVETLNIKHIIPFIFALPRLVFLLRRLKPDLVQTWLYLADFLGGIAAKLAGVRAIVWNIRCAHFGSKAMTGRLVKINAFLSKSIPTSIITCGNEAMRYHCMLGFNKSCMTVLPNGYDLTYFNRINMHAVAPDHIKEVTQKIKIVAIGRNDLLKDYSTLLTAASYTRLVNSNIHFSIYGKNCVRDSQLLQHIKELGLSDSVSLNDEVLDVRLPLLEADLFVSSSMSEGFPNVIAEAMAMSVPCVVTDAGDAAIIVGDTGEVVPIRDPNSLSNAIVKLSKLDKVTRASLGVRARQRIVENYEIGHVAKLYLDHYLTLIQLGSHEKY
jgi:glycosyltransferase involved in cell wall biosynthesis